MTQNRLNDEVSPYLKQHAHNPVHWYSWSDEAFAAAAAEDKPIFLSIGYATCYWCHVMEKDSFERDDVAQILNESFISIKVDREERPDVDQIYMEAVVGLTGHGGWPMSVFLTPEKKPFFGGTFFPRERFIDLLSKLNHAWREDRKMVIDSADSISNSLKDRVLPQSSASIPADAAEHAARSYLKTFDSHFGGFSAAPKFPPSQQIRLLLNQAERQGSEQLRHAALFTLDSMARSALFDHLEGGFHRYATDVRWEIPHFEKMLYDNALLVPAYLDAFLITKNPVYAETAKKTCNYLLNRMQDPAGGFYSAEDAGAVGKEGEFYIWDFEELEKKLAPKDLQTCIQISTVSSEGNFEGKNSLVLRDIASITDPDAKALFKKLASIRESRPRPFLDDKVLTSWNGLAITALSRAGTVLACPDYISAAEQCAAFLKHTLSTGHLLHRYRDGRASIGGLLEDYVFLIEGLINLYQATFHEEYLLEAPAR